MLIQSLTLNLTFLVEEVQQHPCLYTKTYRYRAVTEKAGNGILVARALERPGKYLLLTCTVVYMLLQHIPKINYRIILITLQDYFNHCAVSLCFYCIDKCGN